MSLNVYMGMIRVATDKVEDNVIESMIENHEKWLKDKKEGKRADFSDLELEGYDFGGKDLSSAIFEDAYLRKASFAGTKLVKANMRGVTGLETDFTEADLSYADISCANVCHSNFEKATLRGANMSDSCLWDNNMKGVNAEAVNFTASQLCDCNFEDADLSAAILLMADLDYAHFDKALCENTFIMYTSNTSWASFEGTDLTGADFHASGIEIDDLAKSVGGTIQTMCPEEGSFIAWWCGDKGETIKLMIPEEANRRTVSDEFCSAEMVDVLAIFDSEGNEVEDAVDIDDEDIIYHKGERIAGKNELRFILSRRDAEGISKRTYEKRQKEAAEYEKERADQEKEDAEG